MCIPYDLICILDFEATCWDVMKGRYHEIIEFPSVLLRLIPQEDGSINMKRIDEFQEYCQPMSNKILSDFCIELTGITQDKVDNADNLISVLFRHYAWLQKNARDLNINMDRVCILTCGFWDIDTALRGEIKRQGMTFIPKVYTKFINIKKEFEEFYKPPKRYGMAGMLAYLKIKLEGRHHSGIDDCRNTTSIIERMINDGYRTFGTVVTNIRESCLKKSNTKSKIKNGVKKN